MKFFKRLLPYHLLRSKTYLSRKDSAFGSGYWRFVVIAAILFVGHFLFFVLPVKTLSIPTAWQQYLQPELSGYMQTYFPNNQQITISPEGVLQTRGNESMYFPNPWTGEEHSDYEHDFENILVISPRTPTEELPQIDAFIRVNDKFLAATDQDGTSIHSFADIIAGAAEEGYVWSGITITKTTVFERLDMADAFIYEHGTKLNVLVYTFGIFVLLLVLAVMSLGYALFMSVMAYVYALLVWLLLAITKLKSTYNQAYNRTIIYLIIPIILDLMVGLNWWVFVLCIVILAIADRVLHKKKID